MISGRQSNASKVNDALKETNAKPRETNSAWLQRVGATDGILLLGGASVDHFRIRTSQSHARLDMLPSYWSLAGIFTGKGTFLSVPLEWTGEAWEIARSNGVRECQLADYDDPAQFPNIAAFHITKDSRMILDIAARVAAQRNIIDLPALVVPWVSYVWIVGKAPNPLSEGLGLPSAAFLETVYGIAGIELTPGVASSSSCPEAIWQAARWWHGFYEAEAQRTSSENAIPLRPTGNYAILQVAAAVTWPPENLSTKSSAPRVPVAARLRSRRSR
jgi:hypothetical protein